VTVTKIGALSSPFSFSARTLNSPQCHLFAAAIFRVVCVSVVSIWTSSVAAIGSSSKNQVILAAGFAIYGTLSLSGSS